MKEIIYIFSYTFIVMFSTIYVWHKLLHKKINFKSIKFYITLIGMIITSITNLIITNKFLKIIVVTILLMLFFKYLFKENFQKCIITPIFSQLLVMISETIFILLIVSIFKLNLEDLKNEYIGAFVVNIAISIIPIILVNVSFIIKIYEFILSSLDRINKNYLIVISILIIGISNILAMTTYYMIDIRILIVTNVMFTLFCFLIVLYSFKTQNNYNKVSDKYNIAIKSLNDYEDMMTKYRVANHENKNLLLTVRAMILNKEKDIPKYIDSIIEEKYMDDEKLLFEMSVIPSGGLRATIYSEILKIREHKINYSLNIDRNIKTIDLINLETNTIVEICKIIGVFIDNSIEAVKKLRKKNIDIQLYIEDKNLCIKVSNNYKDNINISKLYDEGYTTKGKDHGYGLALVRNIVDNNDLFENKIEVSKNIFSQLLIIKHKKTH